MAPIPLDVPVGCNGFPATFDELYDQYHWYRSKVRSVSLDYIRVDLRYLRRFFGCLGPPDSPKQLFRLLCPDRITSGSVDYRDKYGVGSSRWMRRSLRSFLKFAFCFLYIDHDLSVLVPAMRSRNRGIVPHGLPDECIAALSAGIERNDVAGLRDSAIVCLLSTYGVRGVHIRRLRLDGIDWQKDRIVFPATKSGRQIVQFLTPRAGNYLVDYITNGRPESTCPEVFMTLKNPFRALPSPSYLSGVLRCRMKSLGIEIPEGVSHGTHGFRHALASRLVGNVPFKDLVDILGHRDPGSTLIYSSLDVKALRQAALPWPGGDE